MMMDNCCSFILVALLAFAVPSGRCQDEFGCSQGEKCIPLRRCPQVKDVANQVRQAKDEVERSEKLAILQTKLCDDPDRPSAYTVCCPVESKTTTTTTTVKTSSGNRRRPSSSSTTTSPASSSSSSSLSSSTSPCDDRPVLGRFKQLTFHPVSGYVVSTDDKTLVLCNFIYDGEGPDAFLIVGDQKAAAAPNARDAIPILPFQRPGAGVTAKQNYSYKDKDIPILPKFDGKQIELHVPGNYKVSDLKWVSVFCRDYDVDFGHAILSADKLPRTS